MDSPNKLHRLKSLTAWQWSVLLSSQFIVPVTWLRLRRSGYKRALAWAQPAALEPSGRSRVEELEQARATAFALAVGIKYGVWKPNCLTRSLALAWFLGRRAIPFEIRIGVPGAMATDRTVEFTAHAWVETHDVVLNDSQEIAQKFQPFDRGAGSV